MLFQLLKPAVFLLDAERAHRLTIKGLKAAPTLPAPCPNDRLAISLAGLDFANPVGLAPGFDKNAEAARAMLGFGFGAVELGTVTPRPQIGNAKPRLFRLVEDEAVINRMGFNNDGGDVVLSRIKKLQDIRGKSGIIGINIGANKDSDDRIADYVHMTSLMAPFADYLTVNISSPNTPGLRALQDSAALTQLLDAVMEARNASGFAPPVFLKVAPDLEPQDITDIVRISMDKKLDALIVSNTTISRPDSLKSRHKDEGGGLSGAPLKTLSQQRLTDFYRESAGNIPLIGVGGIASADDAWARICAGASLVQLYSALVYKGPGLARDIARGLVDHLDRAGLDNISEAIGLDAKA